MASVGLRAQVSFDNVQLTACPSVADVLVVATPTTACVFPGGTLRFDVSALNTTGSTVVQDIWIDAFKPNGDPLAGNPIVGPRAVTFAPFRQIQGSVSFPIPASVPAPSGPFTLKTLIGTFPDCPTDSSSFDISLVPQQNTACPQGVTVTHVGTITDGNRLGEQFQYTFTPQQDYFIDFREVVTTPPGDDGCNCGLDETIIIESVFGCFDGPIRFATDDIFNTVHAGTACGCASVSTQELQCRPRGGGDNDWMTFHVNELKWERASNGDIVVTVTPQGGSPVSASQPGPTCR